MTTFLNQALIFLASAVLLVPLFHRLGLGSVLGYLIAGIVVGPHLLGLISHTESVLHFAELGVVLLLFIIGLEIRPSKLWGMRRQLLGLGLVQILLCTGVYLLAGVGFGLSPLASGVIGFALSLSSTAFALQTLIEQDQLNTEFGKASFAVLLMQDLVAIPALAVIPALASSPGDALPSSTKIVTFLAIVVLLVVGGRFLMRPLFRLIASTRTRELFTATTLFIVFSVGSLMLKIGLSAALGTFMAGVLLAGSEYRHELEANLEPFKGLLMGLFFIGVGMSVGLDLVVAHPLLILGLTAGYLLTKLGLVYVTARLGGLHHLSAKHMALNIGQGGEFAFVIFTIAQGMNLAPPEVFQYLTVVITLTMGIAPLLNLAHDSWERRQARVIPAYDKIHGEEPEVIIAGLGRFGQIFSRILRAQNIPFVAIDHDGEQIELLRKFGTKVYYGDASREEILEAAGARRAKYFVLAIDDVEESLRAVQTVKEHFPHLKVFARARNRGHVFELMNLGVEAIKREVFDSSVNLTRELLISMGMEPARASEVVGRFAVHDEVMLQEQYKVREDDKQYVSVAQQGVAQLQQVLGLERGQSYIRPVETPRK